MNINTYQCFTDLGISIPVSKDVLSNLLDMETCDSIFIRISKHRIMFISLYNIQMLFISVYNHQMTFRRSFI